MNKNLLSFFLLFTVLVFSQNRNSSVGFIENKGQIIDQKGKPNNAVKYLLNTNGLNVQIRKNGFSYDIYETKKHKLSKKEIAKQSSFPYLMRNKERSPDYKIEYIYHRIDIDFANSKNNVKIIAEEKSADYDNYYNVIAKPDGVLDVHKYKKITYRNIYDNIDVVFSIPNDSLKPVEYNFVVRPNGKISDIQLKFKGAKTELVDNKIKMNVRFGAMEEVLPMSWIENENSKTEVAINYKNIAKNVYGFESDVEVSNKILIIDPVPIRLWGTYYAGNNQDYSTDICNDNLNNVYISGYTGSTTNIATTGSFITINGANNDENGFIAKFNTNGQRLWGIYYRVKGIKIKTDANRNLYFTGSAFGQIANITTSSSHQPFNSGGYDNAFLVKFDENGIRQWGTFYGGTSSTKSTDICFDVNNNVYMVGSTDSVTNIATTGSFKTNLQYYDGFIVKFSTLGVRQWGTYFGGSDSDVISNSHISNDGYLYLVGSTTSNDNIGTSGPYNSMTFGMSSGFISKLDLDGQRLWGTYFLNNGRSSIELSDMKDNFLYLSGITNEQNNLLSQNTFNQIFQHLDMQFGYSTYISKFDTTNQIQIWGTYFKEYVQDINVNSNDNLFIIGCTSFSTGIATAGAYDTSLNYDDAYIIKLNQNGQRAWGTYYGGTGFEGFNGAADVNNKISLDHLNNIYIVGNTSSTDRLSTPGSHQENATPNSLGGIYNTFLAKFQDCLSSPQVTSINPCINSSLNLSASGGTNYSWTGPNGFTSSLQNPTILNAQAINSGQYTCIITGTGGCDGPVSTTVVVGDTVKPIPNLATLPTITGDCNTIISIIPTATDNCAGKLNGTTTDALSYTLPGTYTINWKYDDGNGNIETQTQTVTINDLALPTATPNQTFCIQDNATINSIAITGQSIKWYDAATLGNLVPASTLLVDATTYYASQTLNGCESLRIPVAITIQNTAAPTTANASQPFCATQNATLSSIAITGASIKWYATTTSTAALPSNTVLTNATTYYATQTIDNCESIGRLPIAISLTTTLNAVDYSKSYCDDLDDGFENILLSDFNVNLLPTYTNETFSFYTVANSAENELLDDKISINYILETGNHIIYVRIDSVNGCHQVVKLNLTLFTAPIINLKDIVPICENKNITVNAGSGYDSYTWSNGIINQSSIIITQPGSFSVTVTKNNGSIICSTTKNFEVVKSNIASILSIETSDWTNDQNSISIMLSATSVGDYEYSLDGIKYQDSPVFNNLYSGFYTVYINDKNNCGEIKDDAFLLMYPTFFTPNGDGFNDYWKINFSEIESGLSVKIFDRYGKLIKILNNSEQGWDGTFNQKQLPADDYWFVISRRNGKTYKNHFSLKR